MARFWEYFKTAVLVWGFAWLLIVLVMAGWILAENLSKAPHDQLEQDQGQHFNKDFGDLRLEVVRKGDDADNLRVSLFKGKKALASNFALPAGEFNVGAMQITDASVIPSGNNSYRIILHSVDYECDQEASHYLWLLKLDGKMSLVKMLNFSVVRKVEGSDARLLADKVIQLPAVDDEGFERIDIPVMLEIGQSIRLSPLLSEQGKALIRQHYGKIIESRLEKLSKSDNPDQIEQYKTASRELKEFLLEQSIPY
ncbi:MAG TPA: hypothetical protein VIU93_12530 [Gallionellaceae bacterium]